VSCAEKIAKSGGSFKRGGRILRKKTPEASIEIYREVKKQYQFESCWDMECRLTACGLYGGQGGGVSEERKMRVVK